MGQSRASHPRFKRDGGAQRIELTDDDVAILRYVHRHRFVSAADIYRLFANRSADKLSRRLTRLFRNEFLDRPVTQIDRFQDGGSRPLVYGLGNMGARHLKETVGMPIGPTDWRGRNRSYTRENLDHALATSRFLIDLEIGCRARKNVSLIHFDEMLAESPEETRRSAIPGRWAVTLRVNGVGSNVHIIPDAIFGLRLSLEGDSTKRSYVFLEIDRGTMTIAPTEQARDSVSFLYRATILRKLCTYAESHARGVHNMRFGIPAARVLTLTTSSGRADSMRLAANEFVIKRLKMPPGLFLFGVLSTEDPLTTDLLDAGGRPVRLLPES